MWANPTTPTHMQISCINYSSTHPSRCNKSFPVCRPCPLTSLLSATLNKYNPVFVSSNEFRSCVAFLVAASRGCISARWGEIFWRDGADEVGGGGESLQKDCKYQHKRKSGAFRLMVWSCRGKKTPLIILFYVQISNFVFLGGEKYEHACKSFFFFISFSIRISHSRTYTRVEVCAAPWVRCTQELVGLICSMRAVWSPPFICVSA